MKFLEDLVKYTSRHVTKLFKTIKLIFYSLLIIPPCLAYLYMAEIVQTSVYPIFYFLYQLLYITLKTQDFFYELRTTPSTIINAETSQRPVKTYLIYTDNPYGTAACLLTLEEPFLLHPLVSSDLRGWLASLEKRLRSLYLKDLQSSTIEHFNYILIKRRYHLKSIQETALQCRKNIVHRNHIIYVLDCEQVTGQKRFIIKKKSL